MAAKCDSRLAWWLSLANLHKTELLSVADSGPRGFAARVGQLGGQPPPPILALLGTGEPDEVIFIGQSNDPDKCLWDVAGVADSVLSRLCELQGADKLPKKMIIADWSNFVAPLKLSVSRTGQVEQAYRPEPLASDLLALLRDRNIATLGTCPVCGKLFERRRRDQRCDNRGCRDTLRQRRFRQKRQQLSA